MNADKRRFMTNKLSAFICVHLRLIISFLAAFNLTASEHHGQVKFDGLPVPGATVSASQGDKKLVALSDPEGKYSFPDLADGNWTIQVEMLCFATITREVTVAPVAPPQEFELKLLPMDQIKATDPPAGAAPPPAPPPRIAKTAAKRKGPPPPPPTNPTNGFQRTDVNATPPAATAAPAAQSGDTAAPATDELSNQSAEELNKRAADGFLINGTVNNSASSPFSLAPAFGTNRRGPRSLYNGNIGLIENNSAFDARSYSLTGQDTPKPAFNLLTGVVSFGGPMRIPQRHNASEKIEGWLGCILPGQRVRAGIERGVVFDQSDVAVVERPRAAPVVAEGRGEGERRAGPVVHRAVDQEPLATPFVNLLRALLP